MVIYILKIFISWESHFHGFKNPIYRNCGRRSSTSSNSGTPRNGRTTTPNNHPTSTDHNSYTDGYNYPTTDHNPLANSGDVEDGEKIKILF